MNGRYPAVIMRRNRLTGRLIRVTTCSALALLMTAGPPGYDSPHGFFGQSSVYASSCFIGSTRVLMADGRELAISEIRAGDRVVGRDGRINLVRAVERVPLGERCLHSLNGGTHFVTAEHPFMTSRGWRSIDPALTERENPALRIERLRPGDRLVRAECRGLRVVSHGNAAMAPVLDVEFASETLLEIGYREAPASTWVYNLILDGDHSYIADGYLVHNKGGDGGGDGGGDSGGDSDGGSGSDSDGGHDDHGDDGGHDDHGGDDDHGSDGRYDDYGRDEARDHSSWDREHRDDSRGRGLGRGEHGFPESESGDQRLGRGADDTIEGHRSEGEHGELRGDEDDQHDRGRGADDSIEGHRSAGMHPANASNRAQQGFEDNPERIGRDDSPGSRDRGRGLDGTGLSGTDLTPEEEAAAIERGWR